MKKTWFNSEKWYLEAIANAELEVKENKAKLEELLKPQEELKRQISQCQKEIQQLKDAELDNIILKMAQRHNLTLEELDNLTFEEL